jgi:RNA polymerase sigma factor (TIGR02999 family)
MISVTISQENVMAMLLDWRRGDRLALEKLTAVVYDEIRRIAHRFMQRERKPHTLQTTALVNEAYVRLLGHKQIEWNGRGHFLAVVSQVMRQVLIDHARRKQYLKRGGDIQRVSFDENATMSVERAAELLALDEALISLAAIDPRKAQMVELRYFGGLSLEETATVMGVSVMTVRRDWRAAKAWLYRAITTG